MSAKFTKLVYYIAGIAVEDDENDKANKDDNSKSKTKLNARFTKSQARHRYKKGKLS